MWLLTLPFWLFALPLAFTLACEQHQDGLESFAAFLASSHFSLSSVTFVAASCYNGSDAGIDLLASTPLKRPPPGLSFSFVDGSGGRGFGRPSSESLYVIMDEEEEDGAFVDLLNAEARSKVRNPIHVLITKREMVDRLSLRLDSLVFVCERKPSQPSQPSRIFLLEAYAVRNQVRQFNSLGFWDVATEKYTPLTSLSLWERRNDLMGAVLVNSLLPWPPLVENSLKEGFTLDLSGAIAARCNFSFDVVSPADKSWGEAMDEEGLEFNGVVGMVATGKADISTAGTYATPQRERVLDFTAGFYRDTVTLHVIDRGRTGLINVDVFFHALGWAAWCGVAAFLALIATCFFAEARVGTALLHSSEDSESFGVLNSVALAGMMLLQRDYPIRKLALSTRLIFLIASLFAFFVYSGYTAILTSAMISKPRQFTICSFEEVLEGGYRLAVWESTEPHNVFKLAREGSTKHRLLQELTFYQTSESAVAALSSGRQAVAYESVVTFAGVAGVARMWDFPDVFHASVTFALWRNSEFLGLFNHHLIKIRQSGLRDKLLSKWFLSESRDDADAGGDETSAEVLGYENLASPFFLLAGGVFLSGAIVLWESIVRRRST